MITARYFVAALLGFVSLFISVTAQEITSDTYFYGQSPPVYPSRKLDGSIHLQHANKNPRVAKGTGSGGWNAAYAKAKALVAKMTLEEKVRLYPRIIFRVEAENR